MRASIEREIAEQSRAVTALSELVGDAPRLSLGFTDAILLVIRLADHPLAPTEIRDELESIGWRIGKFSNPMASLHQVLKRLEKRRDIEEQPSDDEKRRYRAVGGDWKLHKAFAKPFGAPYSAANTFLKRSAKPVEHATRDRARPRGARDDFGAAITRTKNISKNRTTFAGANGTGAK